MEAHKQLILADGVNRFASVKYLSIGYHQLIYLLWPLSISSRDTHQTIESSNQMIHHGLNKRWSSQSIYPMIIYGWVEDNQVNCQAIGWPFARSLPFFQRWRWKPSARSQPWNRTPSGDPWRYLFRHIGALAMLISNSCFSKFLGPRFASCSCPPCPASSHAIHLRHESLRRPNRDGVGFYTIRIDEKHFNLFLKKKLCLTEHLRISSVTTIHFNIILFFRSLPLICKCDRLEWFVGRTKKMEGVASCRLDGNGIGPRQK